ncbi:AraC family transcriptional regulator [Phaeobacter gallaeciensis]|uniref:AraC family transcriptional regulator n=2 Tax=Phaeobacter gallaeciensis TaxID=60890 RepID=A0ABD4XDQ3_9RHOB|nr:AraC family transcriptional regulator [Phaeobacter gallaeciensis]MDE4146597.1 AraC family transcriptional regulator [Phaeobacter gallaeciensis]MDE4150670.1 AraC family transcriptional regulator [Phaeobacter gallaeciensis]MDE4154849.1 AraC family transcriptional regulator [Phaeobacter gallaeciensis]MDE4159261.1 AraC family transcriptional regulator [Phaeobacter gallaeciensis]MDE4167668.1 AraC family transcriptional regulator [Phaeobacter gallaeciensis]
MTPTPISAEFVEDALNRLRAAGHDPAPLLANLNLPQPLQPVTNALYGQLWWQIAQTMQDEFFGMAARPMRPGSFALLCHAVLHTKTLKQALHRALLFLSVVLDDPRGTLQINDGEARIELASDTPRSAFAYRTYWLILMGVTCWLVGRRIPLRGLDFACPAPQHRSEYLHFFGAPVRFDAAATVMRFDAAHLSLPVIRNDQALRAFLREAPANILVRFRHDQGTAIRVRQHLSTLPPPDWPDFDSLARTLQMSPATLRRHLKSDGQSYLAIKDDLRLARAQKMLDQPGRSVADIAAELGYSEPSAFFRAYRKWTGRSPRDLRESSFGLT